MKLKKYRNDRSSRIIYMANTRIDRKRRHIELCAYFRRHMGRKWKWGARCVWRDTSETTGIWEQTTINLFKERERYDAATKAQGEELAEAELKQFLSGLLMTYGVEHPSYGAIKNLVVDALQDLGLSWGEDE